MKKAQSERKLDRENTTPPSSSGCSSLDDVISQSSQISDVEPLVADYEEFQVCFCGSLFSMFTGGYFGFFLGSNKPLCGVVSCFEI